MSKKTRIFIHATLAVFIFLAGAAGLFFLYNSRSPLAQQKPVKVYPLVRVVKVNMGPARIKVIGEGTVAPVRESTLAAEVAGRVVYMSPALIAGGEFKKGQVLLRINKVDYRLAVTLKQANVKETQTLLQKTEEEAIAAIYEWRQIYGADKSGKLPSPPPLLIKKPQMEEAKAKLAAAKAQLAQAELDLKRTELSAPFDGRVDEKYCDLGQYLKKGEKVAKAYAINEAEVVVHLEDSDLAFLHVPGLTPGNAPGSLVKLTTDFAGQVVTRRGQVVRAEGKVDQTTRLVPVVVLIKDPFTQKPPMVPGMFVKAKMEGETVDRAAVLPRAVLRQGSLVWVVDKEGILRFRPVKVLRKMNRQVMITGGLKDGESVVLSLLKAVSDGMKVRVVPTETKGQP